MGARGTSMPHEQNNQQVDLNNAARNNFGLNVNAGKSVSVTSWLIKNLSIA